MLVTLTFFFFFSVGEGMREDEKHLIWLEVKVHTSHIFLTNPPKQSLALNMLNRKPFSVGMLALPVQETHILITPGLSKNVQGEKV